VSFNCPFKRWGYLYYQASWGSSLDSLTPGKAFRADGTKSLIGVIKQKGNSGFYQVLVSETPINP